MSEPTTPPNNNIKLAKIVSKFFLSITTNSITISTNKGEERGGGVFACTMHLDWLFAFVIPVARFSIEQAINDSACPASDMAICLQ